MNQVGNKSIWYLKIVWLCLLLCQCVPKHTLYPYRHHSLIIWGTKLNIIVLVLLIIFLLNQ